MIELGMLLMLLGLLGIAGAIVADRPDRVRLDASSLPLMIRDGMPAAGFARTGSNVLSPVGPDSGPMDDALGPVRRPVGARRQTRTGPHRPPIDGRPRLTVVRRDRAGC